GNSLATRCLVHNGIRSHSWDIVVKNATGDGYVSNGQAAAPMWITAIDCGGYGVQHAAGGNAAWCIATGCGNGFYIQRSGAFGCLAYANTGSGFNGINGNVMIGHCLSDGNGSH